MTKVVTRFAPSPTGYLHVGGARTALFNWLFARANGGEFRLRIEDTDQARNNADAAAAIIESMDWLGLDYDGDIVWQSQRANRHAEIAAELVMRGAAYRCYLTKDELDEQRAAALAKKEPFIVDSPWRDSSIEPADLPYVVRIKAPRHGQAELDDKVQGKITVENKILDDFIILRSDGTPTYMLAVVVDDHDMEVSHVIRGDDHINNSFKQNLIYHAMQWTLPIYAHIPLIHNEHGKKLTKRDGDLGVEQYRDAGIPSAAVFNYLMRMGWGSGDHEIISRDEALKLFGLEGIGKGAARLDSKRLMHLSGEYMRQTVMGEVEHILDQQGDIALGAMKGVVMPILTTRSRTYKEFDDYVKMIVNRSEVKIEDDDLRALLQELSQKFAQGSFSYTDIRDTVERTAEEHDMKLRKAVEPLRLAIFGAKISPPLFEIMPILGREECLLRIEGALGNRKED